MLSAWKKESETSQIIHFSESCTCALFNGEDVASQRHIRAGHEKTSTINQGILCLPDYVGSMIITTNTGKMPTLGVS